MSAISGLIKVTKKGATAPAKAPPFYSAVDNAVDNLPNKATPEQMIKELLKQKEVKAQELIDRGIDKKLGVPIVQKERTVKLKKPDAKGNTEKVEKYFEVTPGEKGAKAITKDEVINTVEQNPPKQITEDIMGEPTQKMIDQKIEELIEKEVRDELGPRPKYGYEREDWLEDYDRLIEQKSYRLNDYYDEAKEAIKQEGTWGSSKYDRPDWKLAGGENYREIVLKLPPTKSANEQRIMELEAYERRGATDKNLLDELAQLRASRDASPDEFQSKHWDQPNVLAHIRVQDRTAPGDMGYTLVNMKSGNKSGHYSTEEEALAAMQNMPESIRPMLSLRITRGPNKKILHVEEIQSDWHQTGRDKGYKKDVSTEGWSVKSSNPYEPNEVIVYDQDGKAIWSGTNNFGTDRQIIDKVSGQLQQDKVPDAPFKKNWHELAMKRLINYASENGYDKIAITPGAEQAKRYDLSKHIGNLSVTRNPDLSNFVVAAEDPSGKPLFRKVKYSLKDLDEDVGKELSSKILDDFANKPGNEHNYSGLDLKVGGEGMVGFYDQMLPAYLNKYGEKYGAKVGQLPISHGEKMIPDNAGLGMIRSGEPELTQLHSFDITPSMREEVLTKGQPLYQQIGIPAATGAAGAEMLGAEMPEEPGFAEGGAVNENTVPDMSDGGNILQGPPFKRGGKVSITNNPDAMFLELNDKKFRRK